MLSIQRTQALVARINDSSTKFGISKLLDDKTKQSFDFPEAAMMASALMVLMEWATRRGQTLERARPALSS